MGANGAGKSTFVKILTGVVRPTRVTSQSGDGGWPSIHLERRAASAWFRCTRNRRWYPTWTFDRIFASPIRRSRPSATGSMSSAIRSWTCRRSRAICHSPRYASSTWPGRWPSSPTLLLDEMTAALPADLTERVLDVIGRQRGGERSVIFISHRIIEIAAICDRATVLREGVTVGVVDVTARSEERIVELMLGDIEPLPERTGEQRQRSGDRRADIKPRLAAQGLGLGTALEDVSFELMPGEVLGVVALEGQGQDELFDVLAGVRSGQVAATVTRRRSPVSFHHPADAIRAGVVYIAGRPGRGPAHAALGPREHRVAGSRPVWQLGAHRPRPGAQTGRRRRGNPPDRSRARAPRSAACRAGTSRR